MVIEYSVLVSEWSVGCHLLVRQWSVGGQCVLSVWSVDGQWQRYISGLLQSNVTLKYFCY